MGTACGTAGLAGAAAQGRASCSPAGQGGGTAGDRGPGKAWTGTGREEEEEIAQRGTIARAGVSPGVPSWCGDRLETRLQGPECARVAAWAGRMMAGWRALRCPGSSGEEEPPCPGGSCGQGKGRERERDRQTAVVNGVN